MLVLLVSEVDKRTQSCKSFSSAFHSFHHLLQEELRFSSVFEGKTQTCFRFCAVKQPSRFASKYGCLDSNAVKPSWQWLWLFTMIALGRSLALLAFWWFVYLNKYNKSVIGWFLLFDHVWSSLFLNHMYSLSLIPNQTIHSESQHGADNVLRSI